MKLKEKKGITLIALVITILVLLILAGVTIAMLTGENGILTQTKKAKTVTEVAEIKERVKTDVLGWQAGNKGEEINNTELKTILDKYFNEVPEDYDKDTEITAKNEYGGHTMKVSDLYDGEIKGIKSKISKETSYVGCYADIDDDGTVEGIIYADLAKGDNVEKKWNIAVDGKYTIPIVSEGLKDYYVSQKDYKANEGFGTKDVISPTGTGTERFYVMALTDIDGKRNGTYYDWYNAANGKMSDYSSTTSDDFGKGKSNTTTMISKWKAEEYGEQNSKDMWGVIQGEVNKGWFVPSRAEWVAFAGELGISKDSSNEKYYGNFSLSNAYWSSSQCSASGTWTANFLNGRMFGSLLNGNCYVRLSTTF